MLLGVRRHHGNSEEISWRFRLGLNGVPKFTEEGNTLKKYLPRLVRVSPAMVVAMLALFVALTGTTVAATNKLITGKQIQNSSITGLDVKNKSLTPKDFKGSVRGPRGLRGLKGDKGDKGDTGAVGPFPDGDIPAGKTIRGNWIAAGHAAGAGEAAFDSIVFGFRFASAPTAYILAAGAAATPECPGTLATPEAAPGSLCFYTYANNNVTVRYTCNPVTNTCANSPSTQVNRYGTTIRVNAVAAGQYYSWGTWAATSS
jgi:hypothetical protein